jgi:hypothetical protein
MYPIYSSAYKLILPALLFHFGIDVIQYLLENKEHVPVRKMGSIFSNDISFVNEFSCGK